MSSKINGTVTIYGTVEVDEFAPWQKRFEEIYPNIQLDFNRRYVYGTPPPMAKAVIDETKRGKDTADVLIASTAPMLQMENLGILSPHNFDQSVLSKYKHYNDYWISVLSIPTIQMYNPEVIDENDLPKEALDLTNEKWKNKLTTHDLTLGTFGAHWLTKIKDIFGEEKWMKFVHGLANNKPKKFGLFDDLTNSVTDAKTPLAINALHHDLIKAKFEGRPVERLVISDLPVMSTSNAIAITKASKNKNAASTLVQFLLSDEGQAMIGNSYVRIPGNENIAAKYSISNLLPHEAIVHFPDTDAYPRTQSDLNLLRDLFST
ncbi:MAG: extracellular solute-binding protein [Thermoproteota archaeon]